MVRRDGNAGLSRVGRPLPNDEKDTSGQASGSASRIFKGVGKRRESSEASSVGKGVGEDGAEGEPYEGGEEEDGLAVVTDSDGWVYGDNKWEGGSAKGGLGKVCTFTLVILFQFHTHSVMNTVLTLVHLFSLSHSTHATDDGRAWQF
jgi:hypothetical protein